MRTDSRRLTGPNLLLPGPGAVLEVEFPEPEGDRLLATWERHLRALLAALDWGPPAIATRRWSGGASLAFAAPPDVLYAATEVNEWAWDAATGVATESPSMALERLRTMLAAEARPALRALVQAARQRDVQCLLDDDLVSVGLGSGSRTWPMGELPRPDAVPWDDLHDIPVLLVTGSNGKTTTTRLVAAMVRAADHRAGWSSTDGIWVDGAEVEPGDWAGPGGARRVLRDSRVEYAILETARGGMLRRGLPVERARAAVVTNLAEDHFGEYGIHSMADLAQAKLVVARALPGGGTLVLNADDPTLRDASLPGGVRPAWFTTRSAAEVAPLRPAVSIEAGIVTRHAGAEAHPVVPVAEVPATHGGRLGYNVANLVAAVALASAGGIPLEAIARGARGFRGGAADNPGRANHFALGGGVNVIVDFAHNPEGVSALAGVTALFPATPVTILLGQAGDRSDAAMRDLARAAWGLGPALVILKEMEEYRRGRAPGETSAILRRALEELGCPPSSILEAPDELAAVRQALELAGPGALLLLLAHAETARVLDLAGRLEREGWAPGQSLPGIA